MKKYTRTHKYDYKKMDGRKAESKGANATNIVLLYTQAEFKELYFLQVGILF